MAKFWRLMAESNTTATTYAACAGASAASPYTPDFNGTLVGLRVITANDAATSLTEATQFKLTCNTFTPNSIEVVGLGAGLATVPYNAPAPNDYIVDQEVTAGVPITIEARNVTADTPVTPNVLLVGCFEI